MGWLTDLLTRNRPTGNLPDAATCPHDTLTPRWRNHEAMERQSPAMGYVCHRCHAEFLPAQVPHRASQDAAPPDAAPADNRPPDDDGESA